jgi:CMP-2-keto-3-deoxyoctulosonic acid synthetase
LTIEDESLLDDENTVKVVTDTKRKALYFSRSKIPSNGETGAAYKYVGLCGFQTELLLEYINMESELESTEDIEQLLLLENGYEIQTVTVDTKKYTAGQISCPTSK